MRKQDNYGGKPVKDFTGKRFGTILVLRKTNKRKSNSPIYLCRCDCGQLYEKTRPERSESCKLCLGLRPFEALYNRFEARAKHLVLLSYEEFLEFTSIGNCHYCSKPIVWMQRGSRKRQSSSYNLDRKDNDKPYTKENCVVCCTRCNRAKNNFFTYEEWLQIGALIKTWLK